MTCASGLYVLSPNSCDRVECRNEICTLLDLNRRLYVVLIEAVSTEKFPYRLRTIQYANLARNWNDGMKALIEAITGKRDLDADAPAVERVRVITGRIDPRLKAIPISGRDEDLTAIKAKLREQPVAILGVGGLGKSRLAAEIATTSDAVQGAIWHVASDISRADEVIDLLRDHFDLPTATDPRDVFKALRGTPTLIVLDNAESVEAGERRKAYVELITDLVNEKAQVLITGRAEWEELPLVFPYHPQTLPLLAATQVVLDMARVWTPLDLSTHAEALAKAARQHPRLIEWAVKKTAKFPPERVIEELHALHSEQSSGSARRDDCQDGAPDGRSRRRGERSCAQAAQHLSRRIHL